MRKLVAAVAIAASLSVASAQGVPGPDRSVSVLNWGDYFDPAVLDDFTSETGIKVVYDTYDSSEAIEPRLLKGRTGYDVVVTSAALIQRQIKAGALQKLDRSRLPNAKGLWPEIMARLAVADPDNQYAVNYMWFPAGIAYDVSKAKARLPDADPQAALATWDAVFKPDLAKKFGDCGIYASDKPDELFALALNALKLRPDTKSDGDIARAADVLFRFRPLTRKMAAGEVVGALARGDICLAIAWANDAFLARARVGQANGGDDIGFVIPREGSLIWLDNLAIPKDAPHVEAAYKLIDFLLRPEVAARNSAFTHLASGVLAARPLVDPALAADKAVYPDDDVVRRLFPVPTFDPRLGQSIVRLWAKMKTGR